MFTTGLFLCMCLILALAKDEEPLCLSRYDYDYKVLKKIVSLEQEQGKLRQLLETRNELQSKLVKKQGDFDEKLSTLQKDMFAALDNKLKGISPGSGSTYVRWGRTDCQGNGTETVYSGQAGGSYSGDKGAAANHLCLPLDPLWGKYDDNHAKYAPVYGAEYEQSTMLKMLFNVNLDNHDVPCAVCRSPRASVVMVPGRNVCYGGWTTEYTGYLAAGYRADGAASEFVCLDGEPDSITGSQAQKSSKRFFIAEAACGSLKCPPYVDGRELTCAVCSK